MRRVTSSGLVDNLEYSLRNVPGPGRTCRCGGHPAARQRWRRRSWSTITVTRAELSMSDSEYWSTVFPKVYRDIVNTAEGCMGWCGRQQDGAWWVLIEYTLDKCSLTGHYQVGNRAVCYNENLEYSLVKSNGEHYIVATDLLSHPGVILY